MSRPVLHLTRIAIAAALFSAPAALRADAPRDIQTNQRLWLDGLDVNGTDTGNGGGTNPANGAQVTVWKDKSPYGFTAGDAVGYGAVTHTFPTYSANLGVSCDGVSNVLQVSGGIYGVATIVNSSDIFVVTSTRSTKNQFLFYHGSTGGSAGNRISANIPNSDNTIYWDHGSTSGRVSANWGTSGSQYSRLYLYYFGATLSTSQMMARDGSTLASAATAERYSQGSNHHLYICAGDTPSAAHHNGVIAELITYDRRLKAAEKNILQSYLAARHANPGGAGAASRYTPPGNFRYHVGGIGQESDGSLATGTSAGLTITNGAFLANGRYLVAGLDSLNPAKGTVTTEVPAGYSQRAARVWYIQKTANGSPGAVTLSFNLSQMGITAKSGDTIALAYRSGTTGTFTNLMNLTYNGSGVVSASATNPSTGYYTLLIPTQPTYSLATSLAGTTISDTVNTANFKAIPGALVKVTATLTNTGTGSPDSNSTILSLPIPANMKLYLGDIGNPGSGPIVAMQGATPSGLTLAYTSLASPTDEVEFSNNSGASWTYSPTPDAQQADAAITNLRIKPTGTFNTGTSPNFPSLNLTYGLIIK